MMTIEQRIGDFKKRIRQDRQHCEYLLEYATIRLLCHKYLYYHHSIQIMKDAGYDIEEKSWYVMARAFNLISEDVHTPCIDFDPNHPLADKGIEMAEAFRKKMTPTKQEMN